MRLDPGMACVQLYIGQKVFDVVYSKMCCFQDSKQVVASTSRELRTDKTVERTETTTSGVSYK